MNQLLDELLTRRKYIEERLEFWQISEEGTIGEAMVMLWLGQLNNMSWVIARVKKMEVSSEAP